MRFGEEEPPLEAIDQGELHHARMREGAGVIAKGRPGVHFVLHGVDVEAGGVEDVEDVPAELERLAFEAGKMPSLLKAHVEAEKAVAANIVALAALAGESIVEAGRGLNGILEDVGNEAGVLDVDVAGSGLDGSNQIGPAHFIPVGGPDVTLEDAGDEPGGPTAGSGKLPPADERVGPAVDV